MDEITTEAVATHAEAWPRSPIYTCPAGLWRAEGNDGHVVLVDLFVNHGEIWIRHGVSCGEVRSQGVTVCGVSWDGGRWTPVRPNGSDLSVVQDREIDEVIAERDYYHDWADELALAIAPQEIIGEHTSANNPWRNALERQAQVLAEHYERGRKDEQAKAHEIRAMTILQSSLGRVPESVAHGVKAMIERLAACADRAAVLETALQEANDRADRMTESASRAQSDLVETRRQVDALKHALKLHADEMAIQLDEAKEEGRAEERTAIVAGLETVWAANPGDPGAQYVETIADRLKAGEWESGTAITRASKAHAIVEAWERGALAQREAIVSGLEAEERLARNLASKHLYATGVSQQHTARALEHRALINKLQAGEWSAKP